MKKDNYIWIGFLAIVIVAIELKANKVRNMSGLGYTHYEDIENANCKGGFHCQGVGGIGECGSDCGCLDCGFRENGLGDLGYDLTPVFGRSPLFQPIRQLTSGALTNFGRNIIRSIEIHENLLGELLKKVIHDERSKSDRRAGERSNQLVELDKLDKSDNKIKLESSDNVVSFSDIPLVIMPYSVSSPVIGFSNVPVIGSSRALSVIHS